MTSTRTWGGAIAGGLVAGIGMGLIMHFVGGAMPQVGALYGQPTVAFGWFAHLVHSVIFALLFAGVVMGTSLRAYGLLGMIGLGAAYGIVLEIVAAGVVMPLWVNAVGLGPMPVPFIVLPGFVTHVLYGVLLGAVFWYAVTPRASGMAAEQSTERVTP